MLGRRRRLPLALAAAFVALAVPGIVDGASSVLRLRACAGVLEDDGNGGTKPYGGCPRLVTAGAAIGELTAAGGSDLALLSGGVANGVVHEGVAVETYRVSASGAFSRLGCYGRAVVFSDEGNQVATGCRRAPSAPRVDAQYRAEHLAAGPGGALYASAQSVDFPELSRLDVLRTGADGGPAFVDCVGNAISADFGASPCSVSVQHFGAPGQVAASRDGRRVYVVASYGLWTFDRGGDGRLSIVGCTRHSRALCTTADGPRELDPSFWPIVVSGDSRFVYVAGGSPRTTVSVYARTDAAPGLRLVESKVMPSGFAEARALVLGADQRTLYVVADPGVIGLVRATTTGRLSTVRNCIGNGLGASVRGCRALAGDPGTLRDAAARGASLFVAAESGGLLLGKEPRTARLRVTGCVKSSALKPCTGIRALQLGPTNAVVLGNGQLVLGHDAALFALAG